MPGRVRRDSIRFIPREGIEELNEKITKELSQIVGEKNYLDKNKEVKVLHTVQLIEMVLEHQDPS